jgi:hypothetical protein
VKTITIKGNIKKATEDHTPKRLEVTYDTTSSILLLAEGDSVHDKEGVLHTHAPAVLTADRLMLIDYCQDDGMIMYEFVIDDSITDSLHVTFDKRTQKYSGYVEVIRNLYDERVRKISLLE